MVEEENYDPYCRRIMYLLLYEKYYIVGIQCLKRVSGNNKFAVFFFLSSFLFIKLGRKNVTILFPPSFDVLGVHKLIDKLAEEGKKSAKTFFVPIVWPKFECIFILIHTKLNTNIAYIVRVFTEFVVLESSNRYGDKNKMLQ